MVFGVCLREPYVGYTALIQESGSGQVLAQFDDVTTGMGIGWHKLQACDFLILNRGIVHSPFQMTAFTNHEIEEYVEPPAAIVMRVMISPFCISNFAYSVGYAYIDIENPIDTRMIPYTGFTLFALLYPLVLHRPDYVSWWPYDRTKYSVRFVK